VQLIAYILLYPILWVISILPFRLLYVVSDSVYGLLYYIIGYRKKVVQANLDLVFPEMPEKEKTRVKKAFYHHFCDMMLESIKSLTISEAQMKERFKFTNIEEIHALEKKNKSIVLMCAHYGSWEWIFILQKYMNYKGYAIYKRLANKYFDRLVKRIRARYNSYLITTKETVPVLTEAKKNGQLTMNGFISDQSPKPDKAHYWANFLGIKVPFHTGAEMLAKKLDMSVVFFKVKRLKRGYYETTFKTVAVDANTFKDYEITDIFIKFVEDQIREAPEYYLWTHKRWKHRDKVPEEFK